ncbi:MAG: sodium:solute symporter [Chitinophagaceae bacterium]|nr:MAG: sodium:solute symporter [Chitinophagaceae bacterium]
MSANLLLGLVIGYFVILLFVAWFTGRKSNNESFFIGNRNSNWMLVAFGMIGTSLSGVTFVSVPGAVGKEGFAYFQIALGYIIGYVTIAFVLLPLYYRLNVTSIYNYLQQRLGFTSYKTGASFFVLSRTLGATARLYLVVNILQELMEKAFGDGMKIPFWLTTTIILLMILLYTFEGGVKTIVYTDTLQTTCMLAGLVICTFYILNTLGLDLSGGIRAMSDKGYTRIFFTDPDSKLFFVKQILAGAFITITMTGMDQDVFIIALISALFPSADGAITALTSSFCIDLLGIKRRADWDERKQKRVRQTVHLVFAAVFLLCVMVFKWINNTSMIGVILKVAAYTYGPLLGLFTFGLITKRRVQDKLVPVVCIAAPLLCFVIDKFQKQLLGGFEIGSELLILNGVLVLIGLLLISKPAELNPELTATPKDVEAS